MSDNWKDIITIRTPSDGPSIFNTHIGLNIIEAHTVKWMPCNHSIMRDSIEVPCPYCRIALLESVAEAMSEPDVQLIVKAFAGTDIDWHNIQEALQAAGYLGEDGE